MKKLLSTTLSLALAVSLLIGCAPSKITSSSKTTSDNSSTQQNSSTTEVPVVKERVTKLVPDESATGELVISTFYEDAQAIGSSNKSFDNITMAVNKFKELYPNVNIVVNRGSNGLDYFEYANKLATEIMSGKGPDVFFPKETEVDVNKMMAAGFFADMSEFFKNDENFNINDFNQTVFSGGQPDGKQYIIPVEYNVPIILTTERMIAKSGLDVSKFTNYISILNEIDRVLENKELSKTIPIWNMFSPPALFPTFSGIDRFDYSTGELIWNDDEAKSLFELVKKHYEKYTDTDFSNQTISNDDLALKFKNGEALLTDYSIFSSNTTMAELFSLTSKDGEVPVLLPMRNVEGSVTAYVNTSVGVRQNSNNKQNAYNFIKILIAPEQFTDTSFLFNSIPISNNALAPIIKTFLHQGGSTDTIKIQDISDEFLKQCNLITSEIADVDWNMSADRMLKVEMENYLNGKADYETCIANAKEKLKIYLTE